MAAGTRQCHEMLVRDVPGGAGAAVRRDDKADTLFEQEANARQILVNGLAKNSGGKVGG
jgi:hypothetical protein